MTSATARALPGSGRPNSRDRIGGDITAAFAARRHGLEHLATATEVVVVSSTTHDRGSAGGFARERFLARRRAWRRRVWWVIVPTGLLPVAVEAPVALLINRDLGFIFGFGLGAGMATVLILFDSPPARVENWRTGAEGEKATARALRPLLRNGWVLFNDIDTGHGNIDHVLVGPPGVFLLKSKRLAGKVRVSAGTLIVRWHEDPEDGYENDSISARAKGTAFQLRNRISGPGSGAWVQPVVVLWADFDQGSVEQEKVGWVRGDMLADVMTKRPAKYSGAHLEELVAQTRAAVHSMRASARHDTPSSTT